MNNPLLDKNFLKNLFYDREKETYIKIISYDYNKEVQETIEGIATGGSINIDGASAVRRSCSLTLAINDGEAPTAPIIHDFYWSLSTQFQLFIGLKNTLPYSQYPEIIWFPMGWYLISAFSKTQNQKGITINIQGKDKMCQLNGELGGLITSLSADFGTYTDKDGTIKKVLLKDIILNLLKTYAKEPLYNIIIKDLDEIGLELLEYRGETPLFIFIDIADGNSFTNSEFHTLNSSQVCYYKQNEKTIATTLADPNIVFRKLNQNLNINNIEFTKLALKEDGDYKYNVIKIEYGETAGYRYMEEGLVYAGDLILNLGDNITTVLDKIISMLGNYEYFYNLDGQFVFQKKQNLVSIPSPQLKQLTNETETSIYYTPVSNSDLTVFNFDTDELISSKSKNYNTVNIKNDYAIWGEYNSRNIYARYAIDTKPKYYKSYKGNIYYTDGEFIDSKIEKDGQIYNITLDNSAIEKNGQIYDLYTPYRVDWRELIYQMAYDYQEYNGEENFYTVLKQNNKNLIKQGKTGYEGYYVDLLGHWRTIYDPNPPAIYNEIAYEYIEDNLDNLFMDNVQAIGAEDAMKIKDKENLYIIKDSQFVRWIDSADFINALSDKDYWNLYYETSNGNDKIINSLDFITHQAYLKDSDGDNYSRLFSLLDKEEKDKVYYSTSLNGSKKKLQDYLSFKSYKSVSDFIPYNRPYVALEGSEQDFPIDSVSIFSSSGEKIVIWQYDYNLTSLEDETIELLISAQDNYKDKIEYCLSGHEAVSGIDVLDVYIKGEYNSIDKILWYQEDQNTYIPLNNKFLKDDGEEEYWSKYEAYFYLNNEKELQDEFYWVMDLINIDKAKIKYYDSSSNSYIYMKDKINIDEKTTPQLYYYDKNEKMYLGNQNLEFIKYIVDTSSEFYKYIIHPQDKYVQYFVRNQLTLKGEESPYYTSEEKVKINYYVRNFDFILKQGYDASGCWNKEIYNDFTKIKFWFDFIDTNGQINKFSVQNIGNRIKTEKNEKISAVSFGDIPNFIYVEEINNNLLEYNQIKFSEKELTEYFTSSSQNLSIINQVETYINNLTQNMGSMSINIVPIYNLDVNQQIQIEDKYYNIARITVPLSYNGTMSIQANILE